MSERVAGRAVALGCWAAAAMAMGLGCDFGRAPTPEQPFGAGAGGQGAGSARNDPGGAGGTQTMPSESLVRPEPAFPVFDDTRVHTIDLTMAPADWQSIIDDTRGDDWRRAELEYDGVVVHDVGVRPSGESSRLPGNVKMSLRIKFDAFDGRGKFGGRRAIKLDGMSSDLSMLRKRLSLAVFRMQIPTPREAAARVTVNGDLRGHYTIVEIWDGDALADRFAAPLGPLYRVRGLHATDPYLYVGPDPGLYVPTPFEPHIGMPAVGNEIVPYFLYTMSATPGALDKVADVDEMLAFFACNAVLMNTDGLTGDTDVEDHFQYHDPSTGRFVLLPWDPDNTFGSFMEMPDRSIYRKFSRSIPAMLIRDLSSLRIRYEAKIRQIMAQMPLSALWAETDRIYLQIHDVVYEDTVKPFGNGSFEWAVGYVKEFAAQRYAYLESQVGR